MLLATIALCAPPVVATAAAQDRPGPVAELSAAVVSFADDGVVRELLVGGAARWSVSPRISVGPELVYLSGTHHSHVVVTGNVTWDLLAPTTGRAPRVTPFVVAGAGVFQTRESFPSGPFTSADGTFTVGGGVRAPVGDRVTVGVDARVGWELHFRLGGVVGIRLTR